MKKGGERMETLMLLLVFPLVWPWIAKRIWHRTITWPEMGLHIVIAAGLTAGVWFSGLAVKTMDMEILNGEVTGKHRQKVSCEHSYQCNCRPVFDTDSEGNTRTSIECDTCYEHGHDVDWNIYSNIGNFTIDRIDRQGVQEPPRWTLVQKGQPVAKQHMFVNYIRAVPESLFHRDSSIKERFAELIPPYPDNVYDYWHVDRVIGVGVKIPELREWNRELEEVLRELGPKKQANVVVVFVNTTNTMYAHALEEAWLGGKKNDIVIVFGTTTYPKIDWVYVMSWTDDQLFKVKLRDELWHLGIVDRGKTLESIKRNTLSSFMRKPMADFEYLKDEIEPPLWVLILAALCAVGGSIALTIFFHRNEI